MQNTYSRCTYCNLINNQPDIDKIYLYAKRLKLKQIINIKLTNMSKINKVRLDHFNDPKAYGIFK